MLSNVRQRPGFRVLVSLFQHVCLQYEAASGMIYRNEKTAGLIVTQIFTRDIKRRI